MLEYIKYFLGVIPLSMKIFSLRFWPYKIPNAKYFIGVKSELWEEDNMV